MSIKKVRVRALDNNPPVGCAIAAFLIWLCVFCLGLAFWGTVIYVLIKLAQTL